MIRREDVIEIGMLGKPHGLNGEINMTFDNDVFDRVDADYLVLMIDGILVPFYIEEYRFRGEQTALMKLEGVDDAEKARELTGITVYFPKALNDEEEEEMTSWDELKGYAVINDADESYVGKIESYDDSTANMLLIIRTDDGREVLIPVAEELIKELDNKNKTFKMTIPEGLLDI